MGRFSEGRSVQIVRLLKQAGLKWYKSKTFELGAVLAFYAVFSIAPVIVLAFARRSCPIIPAMPGGFVSWKTGCRRSRRQRGRTTRDALHRLAKAESRKS